MAADTIRGRIVTIGSPDKVLSGKAARAAARKVNALTVTEWWRKFLPQHFTVRGGQKYHYQKRTLKYMRMKGHSLPLVFTGDSRQRALSFANTRGSTSNRGVLRINTPTLNLRRFDRSPKMGDEVTRITKGDIAHLVKYHKELWKQHVATEQRRSPRTVKRV